MRALVLLALLLPLVASPAVGADPCALGAGGRVKQANHYVEHRANHDVWIYEETNGIDGLQRGGKNGFGDKDLCVDDPLVIPDRIVF